MVVKNGTSSIYNALKSGTSKNQLSYTFYWFRRKTLIEFGDNWKAHLLFMAFFIGVFCSLLLIFSFYYRDYFVGLVDYSLRKEVIAKLFKLKQKPEMEKLPDLVHNQITVFSNYIVYVFDQIYVFFLGLAVVFFEAGLVSSYLLWWGFGYLLVGGLFTFLLNYWLYKKDLSLQKVLRKRTQQENTLLNNYQLITKKGLVGSFSKDYSQISWATKERSNSRNWVSSICQTLPDYFWIEFASYFLLIFFPIGIDDASSFLREVILPTDKKYLLLMDNVSFHKCVGKYKKYKENDPLFLNFPIEYRETGLPPAPEYLATRNIQVEFITPYFPQLNPVEELFNIIKGYIKKMEPRTYEELKADISKIIDIFQGKDMTNFFKDCLDYDFILESIKSGKEICTR